MQTFYIKIADLVVKMNAENSSLVEFCKKYIVCKVCDPHIVANATENLLNGKGCGEEYLSEAYCEAIRLYKSVAEQLPQFDRFVLHGAAITVDGKGYIFTAPAGTGKSTHIKLWLDNLGERAEVINGDKPILRKNGEEFEIYGSPWAGKEGWHNNISAGLNGICFITRGVENKITKIPPRNAVARILKQIYMPEDKVARDQTFVLMDQLLKNVPLYLLECDMSKEAFVTSFEAMTGEKFDK